MSLLRATDLSYRYDRSEPYLFQGLDVEVTEPGIYEITGESGSGTTTLLDILRGERQPETGQVELLGQDPYEAPKRRGLFAIFRPNRSQPVKGVSFLEQYPQLDASMTCWENMHAAAKNAEVEFDEAATRDMMEMMDIAPLAHVPGNALSGGQSQRFGVVKAMVSRPEVVLADNPVSALDEANRRGVEKLLSSTTVIFTSHRPLFQGVATPLVSL